MRLEVSLLKEGTATVFEWADEVPAPIVILYVNLQSLNAAVGLRAALHWAYVLLDKRVGLAMILEVSLGHERFTAAFELAGERPEILKRIWFL
jgi:hypothetical protein